MLKGLMAEHALAGALVILSITMSALLIRDTRQLDGNSLEAARNIAIVKMTFNVLALLLCLALTVKVFMRKGAMQGKVATLLLLAMLMATHSLNIVYYNNLLQVLDLNWTGLVNVSATNISRVNIASIVATLLLAGVMGVIYVKVTLK